MSFKAIFATVLAAAAVGGAHAAAVAREAETYSGDATYYYPAGAYGACGSIAQNTDYVVALSPTEYAGGANCYREIGVNYQGHFVQAKVVDLCTGCASGSIDLSPVAFEQLAPLSVGRIQVSWNYE